ncbi:hypothetical protein HMPREF1544_05842 [Mucor circinelloides 1006PhL]|uniref:Uncharacterized protein n=1 Tax=Mucor circinelloides f. circinelloides (strain 1006PhL) TaxID=1220926 RepID=S2JFR0_MUCC1|nr:hypothetical protein HMPREF1544_05842 [Mucor circinelloides 1006PhL]
MEANNYVESWHNQLKTVYLHRKRDRRVDRLIYILVNDVEPNFIQNISRNTLSIDRMGPEEGRRRELNAEAINEAIISTMIDDRVTTFKVASSTSEHTKHDTVVENEAIVSCILPHSLSSMEMMLLDQQTQAAPPVQLQEALRSRQNQAMGNV